MTRFSFAQDDTAFDAHPLPPTPIEEAEQEVAAWLMRLRRLKTGAGGSFVDWKGMTDTQQRYYANAVERAYAAIWEGR